MKNFIIALFSLQSLFIGSIEGSDHTYIKKYNDVNTKKGTRSFLFKKLFKEECSKNNIVDENKILELKENIESLNKKETIKKEDLLKCLHTYADFYAKFPNEHNNIDFITTVIPVLLEKYNFSPNKDLYKNRKELSPFNNICKENHSLIRTLLYHYNFSLVPASYVVGQVPFPFLMHTINIKETIKSLPLTDNKSPYITYLKAIVTPPSSWMKKEKKALYDTVLSLLLSLKRVKKKESLFIHCS